LHLFPALLLLEGALSEEEMPNFRLQDLRPGAVGRVELEEQLIGR
jgi:hypothetical protein